MDVDLFSHEIIESWVESMVVTLRNQDIQELVQRLDKCLNLLKPTAYVMHQQFNIQQM